MQCNYYANSCQCAANSSSAFQNFLEFFSNILNPWLVESEAMELTNIEGLFPKSIYAWSHFFPHLTSIKLAKLR